MRPSPKFNAHQTVYIPQRRLLMLGPQSSYLPIRGNREHNFNVNQPWIHGEVICQHLRMHLIGFCTNKNPSRTIDSAWKRMFRDTFTHLMAVVMRQWVGIASNSWRWIQFPFRVDLLCESVDAEIVTEKNTSIWATKSISFSPHKHVWFLRNWKLTSHKRTHNKHHVEH